MQEAAFFFVAVARRAMTDKPQRPSAGLLEMGSPGAESASLLISSGILVMMLRIVGALRPLVLTSGIGTSPDPEQIRETVQELERRLAAMLTAIDEMIGEPAQQAHDR
jgi:hypothetical protein